MNTKTLYLLIGALVVVLVGSLIFMQFNTVSEQGSVVVDDDATDADPTPYDYIDRVDMVQFYADNMHTFVGEIDMPTPCDLLEATAEVRESMPEQIHISFNVINESEMCAQVITPARFMVTAPASEEATVTADFMGRSIELNLREPAPGETPEDFELFIKG